MTTTTLKNEISKALKLIHDKPFLEALYTLIHDRAEHADYELSQARENPARYQKRNYKSGKEKTLTLNQVRKKVEKRFTT